MSKIGNLDLSKTQDSPAPETPWYKNYWFFVLCGIILAVFLALLASR